MNYNELIDGNGQKIYVELGLSFLRPEWFDEETGKVTIPDNPKQAGNLVYRTYKELFDKLYEKGYRVITDALEADEDTFYFTPCLDVKINGYGEVYREKKNKKVIEALKECGIEEPISVNFPVDKFPEYIPELPFVLKNENMNCGDEKFIIRTKEQLERLRKFYDEINGYSKAKDIEEFKGIYGDDVEIYDNKITSGAWTKNFIDYKYEFHKNMRIQKYVSTPSEYNTSLRVLFTSNGDVLASSLKYSKGIKTDNKRLFGLFEKYLSDPSSPYFIGNESIVSNTAAGGNSILLEKESFTEEEKRILALHNIDPENVEAPKCIKEACENIALHCKREIGSLCGIDFIYDKEEHKWKYLEEHEYPMMFSYCERFNLPYNPENPYFNMQNIIADIDARFKALTSEMNQKRKQETVLSKKQ